MKGKWVKIEYKRYGYQFGKRNYALVFFDGNRHDSEKPWCAYTFHTEGNDYFKTLNQAKVHARGRLKDLVHALKPLMQ